jgi:hypothetical protein
MATERYADLLKQGFMKSRAPTVGFKTYKKIDIYLKRPGGVLDYLASTNARKTCKEAREKYAVMFGYAASDLVAKYARVS